MSLDKYSKFAENPELIQSLDTGERIRIGIDVLIQGMATTFITLAIIWLSVVIMSKIVLFLYSRKEKYSLKTTSDILSPNISDNSEEISDDEMVAITSSVAESGYVKGDFVVLNIRSTGSWRKASIQEQMNSRYQS